MAGGKQPIDKDLRAFRDLSLWLWNSHEKPWEYGDRKARTVYEKISRGYQSIISPEELEEYLPNEEKVQSAFPARKYLYLNPVEGIALVPILTIASDFGRSIPELRIGLGLFLLLDGEPSGFGYRFESPEGSGIHHYYHAQPITDLKAGESFLDAEDWLPTKCPTFPLDADNPVKLLLSLLIALYGVLYISKIRPHVYGLDAYLDKMHCNNMPDLKWYRKVITKVDRFHEISDKQKLDEFEKSTHAQYPGCKIVGITRGNYDRYGPGRLTKASSKRSKR
jgi:hypothetical protein